MPKYVNASLPSVLAVVVRWHRSRTTRKKLYMRWRQAFVPSFLPLPLRPFKLINCQSDVVEGYRKESLEWGRAAAGLEEGGGGKGGPFVR